ncbi:Asp-tRNA(Asn)/Glu-tRNA(Gln) amidotransferase subunit GatC [Patescibacteria group bacterium]|nr:Asp-tRNA(Asn)/Glu-tRNA(Gln) amidotransferase subunit GatC [Patescibacteria group bacterium]
MNELSFDVDKIARLANMDLTDEKRARFSKDLPSIVSYVSRLQEVDTSAVEAKEYLTDLKNIFAADVRRHDGSGDGRDEVVEAFPYQSGGALEVPGIFE